MGFFHFCRIWNEKIGIGFEMGRNRVRLFNLPNKTAGQLWEINPDDFEPFQALSGEKATTFIAVLLSRHKFEEEQIRLGVDKCRQIEECVERKDFVGEQNVLAEMRNQVSTNYFD